MKIYLCLICIMLSYSWQLYMKYDIGQMAAENSTHGSICIVAQSLEIVK